MDIAVHVFILDTPNYRAFCTTNFDGKFLEHIPETEFKNDGSIERTAHIIAANGFPVDWPLWETDFATCGPCSPGSLTARDRPRSTTGLPLAFHRSIPLSDPPLSALAHRSRAIQVFKPACASVTVS
ncbi:hypothetical protein ACFU9Y_42000 [Streptomyces sp. NPDC057621]|uniref:hypothetical protein n=1 Tax=Streptomyces sp. NPDC057621 TaxID=3346186 RepID=UPI00368C75CB